MSDAISPGDQTQELKGLAGQFIRDSSQVYSNLGQEIIITTEDKIRLCLIEHLSRMEKRHGWIAPLGILITILMVFPTTTFQVFLSLSADTWKALFVMFGLICVVWLIKSIWDARVSSSMDEVVANIKQTGLSQPIHSVSGYSDVEFPILSGIQGMFSESRSGPWTKSVVCDPIHPAWKPALKGIEGAKWIWLRERPTDQEAQSGQTVWHQLQFKLAQTPTRTGTLTLMVDDYATVYMNGNHIKKVSMTENVVAIDVKPHLRAGKNIMEIEIENKAYAHETGLSNPTGIIYRLDIR